MASELPDELEELKTRLILELDGYRFGGSQTNRLMAVEPGEVAVRVLTEWYEEYRGDYEVLMSTLTDEKPTFGDTKEATHWALQNLS